MRLLALLSAAVCVAADGHASSGWKEATQFRRYHARVLQTVEPLSSGQEEDFGSTKTEVWNDYDAQRLRVNWLDEETDEAPFVQITFADRQYMWDNSSGWTCNLYVTETDEFEYLARQLYPDSEAYVGRHLGNDGGDVDMWDTRPADALPQHGQSYERFVADAETGHPLHKTITIPGEVREITEYLQFDTAAHDASVWAVPDDVECTEAPETGRHKFSASAEARRDFWRYLAVQYGKHDGLFRDGRRLGDDNEAAHEEELARLEKDLMDFGIFEDGESSGEGEGGNGDEWHEGEWSDGESGGPAHEDL